MSKVISFRMDKANPREAQALNVLEAWIEQGYSLRFIFTKALLDMDQPSPDAGFGGVGRKWDWVLKQIGQLIESVNAKDNTQLSTQDSGPDSQTVSDMFVTSIKKAAKPGINAGE